MTTSVGAESPAPAARPARRVWSWIIIAATASLLAAAVAWAFWPAGMERAHIDAYRTVADGSTIEVHYSSGHPCEDAVVKRVLEYETTVVVDIAFRAYPRSAVVPAIAYACEESFPLISPVGNRVVTDIEGDPVIGPWDMVVTS